LPYFLIKPLSNNKTCPQDHLRYRLFEDMLEGLIIGARVYGTTEIAMQGRLQGYPYRGRGYIRDKGEGPLHAASAHDPEPSAPDSRRRVSASGILHFLVDTLMPKCKSAGNAAPQCGHAHTITIAALGCGAPRQNGEIHICRNTGIPVNSF